MREKLLVADDEPDIVTMLKNYFELNGYDVLTAANGLPLPPSHSDVIIQGPAATPGS